MYYTNIDDYEQLLNKNLPDKYLPEENLLSKNDDPSPDNGFALSIVITLVTLFLLLP